MKKIVISIIILIILVVSGIVLFFMKDNKINKPNTDNDNPVNIEYENNNLNNNESINIKIEAEGIIIKGTLTPSETANDFLELLPLEIKMTNFYDREYAGGLGTELSTNGKRIDTFTNGDITYYVAGRALAIFYDKDDSSRQGDLIKMGKITSSLDYFKDLSDEEVFTVSLDNDTGRNEEQIILNRFKEYQTAMIDKDMKKLNEMV